MVFLCIGTLYFCRRVNIRNVYHIQEEIFQINQKEIRTMLLFACYVVSVILCLVVCWFYMNAHDKIYSNKHTNEDMLIVIVLSLIPAINLAVPIIMSKELFMKNTKMGKQFRQWLDK